MFAFFFIFFFLLRFFALHCSAVFCGTTHILCKVLCGHRCYSYGSLLSLQLGTTNYKLLTLIDVGRQLFQTGVDKSALFGVHLVETTGV